ncbi:LysM peptidoglycan-binding domain-containing protein [Candidatus Pelagibacter sp. HIMB109]|uniref:LysM peptidoglycan-binding domain-containing protein n=1 Tax=Candidatus Pelagibacter sp. HIMB109 TaxID=3415412 RepID=UPI003F83E108
MIKKILLLLFIIFIFSNKALLANVEDPFTRSLGDGSELNQASSENENNKEKSAENNDATQQEAVSQTEIPVNQVQQPVSQPVLSKLEPIGNILAPNPLIAYDLVEYTLKGTALNAAQDLNMVAFNREGSAQKVDYGNIKTTHIVNQNDTIESIAARYGYASQELKIANSIVPGSKLIMGTRITLPARVHKVQKGQSLEMIAEIYSLELKDLIGFNNLMPGDELQLGEKLLLPFYVYRTNSEETIEQISKKFNRTKKEVLKINNLSRNDKLNKGQYVKIPIFVNPVLNVEIMKTKRGLLNYTINPKNLAIIEIRGNQFMVREGDKLGKNGGKIVKITNHEMKVLENYEEFSFQINAPIVNQVASIPQVPTVPSSTGTAATPTGETSAEPGSEASSAAQTPSTQESASSEENSITNVEDLFR